MNKVFENIDYEDDHEHAWFGLIHLFEEQNDLARGEEWNS